MPAEWTLLEPHPQTRHLKSPGHLGSPLMAPSPPARHRASFQQALLTFTPHRPTLCTRFVNAVTPQTSYSFTQQIILAIGLTASRLPSRSQRSAGIALRAVLTSVSTAGLSRSPPCRAKSRWPLTLITPFNWTLRPPPNPHRLHPAFKRVLTPRP